MTPLRMALRTVLGQSQKMLGTSHPSRVGTGYAHQPSLKDVRKLSDAVGTIRSALTNLAACIEEDSSVKANDATLTTQSSLQQPSGVCNSGEQERLARLEEERLRLLKREEELNVLSVDDTDLEQVVQQLRTRVGELEAREAKVSQLRHECGNLRARISELIAATIDHKALEEENARLLAQAAELHQAQSSASRRCHEDSSASVT